ncbi:MAG: class I SAM-dependent methyltransferase [Pyrinomonadaceae bacterium]|nr:class I SAM-dependent methyltransferase [Pyrinomonadaceae bacterium]
MVDSIQRFSTRVGDYAKFRPTYPRPIIDLLKSNCGLTEASIVADVGSGTGILSKLLLRNGNRVFGVEPNEQMRSSAEKFLSNYQQFTSVDGAAEATTLKSHSVDLITAAQAFHWFDRIRSRVEFARILKEQGWVALIWNERRLDSTPFLRAFEQLLLQYGTDYQKIRHENVTGQIADFFAPQELQVESFENVQTFDFESLLGRVRSASYTPEPDKPSFAPMIASLRKIFEAYERSGTVAFEYDTKVYYGQLDA